MIAYQTAYLKSHYPVEFLASLLTCDMDNTDKVILHVNECREMGIQVLPPDVNESHKNFTVVKSSIRFGLAAVKNVGQNAIEAILKAREKQERFSSLHEFCQKVEQRTVNKRVIESLVKCGAFDSTGAKRWELMSDLPSAMESGQRIQKDRVYGQKGLFGFNEIYESNHKSGNGKTNVTPWEENEILAYEKETLGFYITGHPLANQKRQLDRFCNCNSQNISEMNNGRQINIGGIIIKVRTQMTKKGKIMAYITLEDLAGFVEIIVFPDIYKATEPVLKSDNSILVKGYIDTSNETIKIIAKDIMLLSEAVGNWTGKIHINIQTAGLEADFLGKIKSILAAHRGKNDVLLHLISPDGKSISMNTSSQLKVAPDDKLILEIEGLLGKDSIYFELRE
jgi:DNA polymerase-3 subunit alpha